VPAATVDAAKAAGVSIHEHLTALPRRRPWASTGSSA
jgi:hypothetical protein